ncbi:MAG: ABC transporter substrate-binding protein [Deltaproteobacteria bacterium]|nr:ABC transporter substrate-binding protein [Deltaproteobacteria bacterium]
MDRSVLRIGHLFNITHGPALVLRETEELAHSLRRLSVEWRAFSAGPSVVEALLGGAVDVVYSGPSPILAAHLRSRGTALRVLSGACSGGAGLVVQPGISLTNPQVLNGRTVSSPQLGNTQDVSLRTWLARHGMSDVERGGQVRVLPLPASECFNQFRLGRVHAAWVPEPTLSRIVALLGGVLAVDERDLWPQRRFASTLLAARTEYLAAAPDTLNTLLQAHVAVTQRLAHGDARSRALVRASVDRAMGRPLAPAVYAGAFAHCDYTVDPLIDTVRAQCEAAQRLEFLPAGTTLGLLSAR